ncbi:hypothetical protein [Paraburkholderia tropica]|uniref:hypothetical protein n=1 Tax=Paraburkholderia tropica TaxID=92647 RepID=UPI001592A177|nr:hypothetical protein [Paraburkholderia tropica]
MKDDLLESLHHTRNLALSNTVMVATEHIAELDACEDFCLADFDATAVINAVQSKLPMLGKNSHEQLLSYLTQYALLRKLATSRINAEDYMNADGKILFRDLCHVLDEDEWHKSRPDFYSLFMSLAQEIEAVIDAPYTIPW